MKKTILICDDDSDILELCTFILARDYSIETCSQVDDIINLVVQKQPHLILMDLWIPEVGGEKAVALLKNHSSTSSIPVVLFSANEDIEKISVEIKADGYIKKPFSVKELRTYVMEQFN